MIVFKLVAAFWLAGFIGVRFERDGAGPELAATAAGMVFSISFLLFLL